MREASTPVSWIASWLLLTAAAISLAPGSWLPIFCVSASVLALSVGGARDLLRVVWFGANRLARLADDEEASP